MDTKDLTVVGVARSQCSVFAAKFCRRHTISSFIAPPNGEIFLHSLRVRLTMLCAKFGVDRARNVGGVGKRQFSG